mmetsp:Transcript_31997/g.77845  ORF Transcript_31997/g.77845 Transcript_31997/m.77845 type:complete len:209 (+) Transcript_31997:60-686(+)
MFCLFRNYPLMDTGRASRHFLSRCCCCCCCCCRSSPCPSSSSFVVWFGLVLHYMPKLFNFDSIIGENARYPRQTTIPAVRASALNPVLYKNIDQASFVLSKISTSNSKCALAGMTSPTLRFPYPNRGGIRKTRRPPTFIPSMPWDQPGMTRPGSKYWNWNSCVPRELPSCMTVPVCRTVIRSSFWISSPLPTEMSLISNDCPILVTSY